MADNLSTIAFRAKLLERCEYNVATSQKGLALWTSLYQAVQTGTLASELSDLLRSAWLSGIVTSVETVLTDTLLEVLVGFPGKLGKKQLTVQELNESGSHMAAIQRIARRTVNDLSYANLSEYLKNWQENVGELPGITPEKIEIFTEIKGTRDVYVHNNGIPNEIYQRKTGPKGRKPERTNPKLKIDEAYLSAASQLACEFVQAVRKAVTEKFPRCTKLGVFEDMWNATCCGKLVKFDQQWEIKGQSCYRKPFVWNWSSSEKALFDIFLRIFHYDSRDISTDIQYALNRWSAETPEGLVIRSWIQCPFYI